MIISYYERACFENFVDMLASIPTPFNEDLSPIKFKADKEIDCNKVCLQCYIPFCCYL
jgi:hypothetical protein